MDVLIFAVVSYLWTLFFVAIVSLVAVHVGFNTEDVLLLVGVVMLVAQVVFAIDVLAVMLSLLVFLLYLRLF